jgi:hypothetical protein
MALIRHRLEVMNHGFGSGIHSSLASASHISTREHVNVINDDSENWAKHYKHSANCFRVFLTGPFGNEFNEENTEGKNQKANGRPPSFEVLFRNIKDGYVVSHISA